MTHRVTPFLRASGKRAFSRPAMSSIFAKLKKNFNDLLMIRVSNQYVFTSHAQTILQELNHLMPQLDNLVRDLDQKVL